jgi:Flp pilus assembly secretin CpaC
MTSKHKALSAVAALSLMTQVLPAHAAEAEAAADTKPAAAASVAEDKPVTTQHVLVAYDQARPVRLDVPVKTIVIGNASVAEAMLVNDRLIYIQGRIFGTTNLVALDHQGREIYKAVVTVGAPETSQVTLYRGNAQFTMVCSPRCERTVTMGDADMEVQAKSGTGKMDVAKVGAGLSTAP